MVATPRTVMSHSSRYLMLVLVVMLLQGCSSVRLGYEHADSLVRWWIDQYVDLSPEQDLLTRERLSRIHAWHRKTQLPDYAAVTRQAQKLVAGQPTADDVLALLEDINRRMLVLAEQAAPDIADLLLTLSAPQVDRMAGQLAEKAAVFAKEVQLADGPVGQRKAQFRRLLERYEYWFGSFSAEQEMALRKIIETQASGTRFWYDERLRRQREWLALVRPVQRERPPREQLIRTLYAYAGKFDLPGDPARLAEARALRRNTAELYLAIHGMTSPAQRAHALHKLADLAGDFTALSLEQ